MAVFLFLIFWCSEALWLLVVGVVAWCFEFLRPKYSVGKLSILSFQLLLLRSTFCLCLCLMMLHLIFTKKGGEIYQISILKLILKLYIEMLLPSKTRVKTITCLLLPVRKRIRKWETSTCIVSPQNLEDQMTNIHCFLLSLHLLIISPRHRVKWVTSEGGRGGPSFMLTRKVIHHLKPTHGNNTTWLNTVGG